jgi:hypothetical protein
VVVADTITRPDVASMPTADEIFDRPAPVDPARTKTREILNIGIDMITATTDDLAAVALERILEHLADVADHLAVVEMERSEALTLAYQRHVTITRLREQNADLREFIQARPA